MRKIVAIALLTALAAIAGGDSGAPKELIGYVQDAKKLGLSPDQIRRNAVAGGWKPEIVDAALTAVDRGATRDGGSERNTTVPSDYRIGSGDVLQVSVWKEPEVSVPSVAVRADGKITLPLVKDVEVAGLTPAELEKLLAERLSKFIPGADVTVIVQQIHSRKLYLVGAIRTVGSIDLRGEMTVLQAIAQAGGLTEYAKRKEIYILRRDNGRQVKLPFNYEAVIKGESMDQNFALLPNDMIVVPQ